MTSMEVLHEIVSAEQAARKLYGEAVRRQEGFAEYLEAKKTKLHDEYFNAARERLAEHEARETAKADAAIAVLDKKLETELSAARESFEANRAALAVKVFELAVGLDA